MCVHVVNVDFPVNICSDQSTSVRTDGTVLNTEPSGPHIESLAAHAPVAELSFQIQRCRDKGLSIGSPGGSGDRFPVMVDSHKTATRLFY